MLTLAGVTAGYGGVEVLHGISLQVSAGEIVTLIGANGAGKTTTLMTICGIVRARAGSIHLEGHDIAALRPQNIVARGISQSPEGRKIFPRMSVLENLEMGAFLRRDTAGIRADIERVFGLFSRLRERQSQVAGTLSGGEQQMLAMGRAMLARPKLLILDEPSLGLAPLIIRQLFDVIRQLNEAGTTILLVEQNAQQALKLAHRGYVMETGRITMAGTGAELLADPRIRSAYLGD